MSEEDESFYMAIQDPKDFRRELLSSNKEIIQIIRRYEQIKEIRAEKVKKLFEFSEVYAEIKMLTNKLQKTLPTTKLAKITKKLESAKSQKKLDSKKGSKDTISKLQKELELVESKLSKLS